MAIAARSVGKTFRLPHEKYTTVKDKVLHPFSGGGHEVLRALEDVSFEIRRGEAFGVVGRNGSGKSTLLKCVSSIYRVDTGDIEVHGRLAPFIELGVGFNPNMSARDNVLVNAVLLGLTPAQARDRLGDIMAFAELEEFEDMKLKNFSSGMTVRLAFAVTIQVDADILLFDEVLTVGDASFQRKCLDYFDRLKADGRTVVLVTHDMGSVERFCDRAMLLDHGRVVELGEAGSVAAAYTELNLGPREGRGAGIDAVPVGPRPAGGSRRRPGPSLLGPDPRRVFTLSRTLATAEFKVRYLDAALSYLWVLMGPLLFFAILYVVFKHIGAFDEGVRYYPLYLLSSLVLWMYFATATDTAVDSLVRNEPLLRRIPFPHLAIPLSVVLVAFFDLVMSSLAVLAFVLASGVEPRLSWLEVPVLVAGLTMFITGVAMLLAALYVRFRDLDHIWVLVRQGMFYLTPIFYVAAFLPDDWRPFAMANPLAAIFTQMRHAVLDPSAPTAAAASGGGARILIPVAIVIGVFGLGLWVFRRASPTVAENL